jgi:HK97 family phage portal protein
MKILDKFFEKQFEKRMAKLNVDNPWQWPSLQGLFTGSNSGKYIDEWTSLQLSIVYACIRIISNTIAMLPLSLYQKVGESSKIAENKSLNNVLYRMANKNITAFVYKQMIMSHILLFGNSYSEIIRNGTGEVIELYPLNPWQMEPKLRDGIKKYHYRTETKEYILLNDNVLHIAGLSFDGIKGYSPIQIMKNEIGLGLSLQEFGGNFFKNGANIGSFFTHPGQLGQQAKERLQKDINRQYVGEGNYLKNILLEEGMKYEKVTIPLEDAQFIMSRKFQVEEICRYFGVQPHMVQNLENATFSNIEQQSLEFKTYCIQPWATLIENCIWKDLLTKNEQNMGYYAKFNFNSLMRSDYQTRMQGYSTAVQNGIFSINDVLKLEDMDPISDEDGGNTHFINSASVPIKQQMEGMSNEK